MKFLNVFMCKAIYMHIYYTFNYLIGSDSNLISIDSLKETRFVSNSLQSRGSDFVREVDHIWFVNAYTEFYRDGKPAFASGEFVSGIASALPLWPYEPHFEPAPPATCTASNLNDRADECISLHERLAHPLARPDRLQEKT